MKKVFQHGSKKDRVVLTLIRTNAPEQKHAEFARAQVNWAGENFDFDQVLTSQELPMPEEIIEWLESQETIVNHFLGRD